MVEKIPHCFHDCMPHFQNRMLLFRTQPEMTIVQKKFRAMLFRRDGKVVCVLNYLRAGNINLDAARRAIVFANAAGDD